MRHHTRRDIIRQFGLGAALLIPLLRNSRGLAATDNRLMYVGIFKGTGVNGRKFWPKFEGTSTSLNGTPLQDFESMKEYMTLIKGVNLYKKGGNAHGTGCSTVFTGTTSDKPPGGRAVDFAPPPGASIDQIIADHFYAQEVTPLKFLPFAVNPNKRGILGQMNFLGDNKAVAPINEAAKQYDAVVGRILGVCSGEANQVDAEALRRQEIILNKKISMADATVQELKDAKRLLSLNAAEKAKLDEYAESLHEMKNELTNLSQAMQNQSDGSPKACPTEFERTEQLNVKDLTKFSLDLMHLALEWKITRVATSVWGGGQHGTRYSFLSHNGVPLDGGYHKFSHPIFKIEGQSDDYREKLTIMDTWCYSQMAYFAEKCKNTTYADGSNMLDHMILLTGSEVADGVTHSNNNIPYFVIGKGGGSIKGNQFDVLSKQEGVPNDSHQNLLLAVARAAGLTSLNTFGDEGANSSPTF